MEEGRLSAAARRLHMSQPAVPDDQWAGATARGEAAGAQQHRGTRYGGGNGPAGRGARGFPA
ncbi:helix-turn-helix domain-containing protein [Streptomyces chartreusis]